MFIKKFFLHIMNLQNLIPFDLIVYMLGFLDYKEGIIYRRTCQDFNKAFKIIFNKMWQYSIETIPLQPMRNSEISLFHQETLTINSGRKKTMDAISMLSNNEENEEALLNKKIAILHQKNRDTEEPTLKDLHHVGYAAQIVQVDNYIPSKKNSIQSAKIISN